MDAADGADRRGDGDARDAHAADRADIGEAATGGAAGSPPCTTRITYGSAWIHPPSHPEDFDVAAGQIGWDGTCAHDGNNSYAVLSNGWKPYFTGRGTCAIALDYAGCPGAPSACATRVAYGPAWMPAPNHPDFFDDVPGVVHWNGACRADGANSYALLSNGWAPHFSGSNACDLSFRYTECGSLYANPVLDVDCPDPGVLRDGAQYVMACTSGNAPDAFPLRASADLVHWQSKGHVFPAAAKPAWAKSDFWAPEIHRVGNGFVAYFTARHQDGRLSIGAATSGSPLGPFSDIGHPLLHDAGMGLIDATHFEAPNGKHYVIWKEDGNAVGKPTPIHGQELTGDGLGLVGARATLITNDQAWEGTLVEGPWMIHRAGQYYLFYSGNFYASAAYAIGVARSASPLGPFTKAAAPLVRSAGAWAGPGHGSVILAPSSETWFVYHSWKAGHVNGPGDGRVVLIDRVLWDGAWPMMYAAPSSPSAPVP
jgi:GH43 family beta-xylosidase